MRNNPTPEPPEIEITPAIVDRVGERKFGLYDPCVVCAETFTGCPHTLSQTESVIRYVNLLTRGEKNRIMNGEAP